MKVSTILAGGVALLLVVGCAQTEATKPAEPKPAAQTAQAEKPKPKLPDLALSGSPFTVYFKLNSTDLTEKSHGDLFDILQKVNEYKPKTVTVISHTDLTGSPEYNMKLSQERAEYLAKELKEAGAPEVKIVAEGQSKPLVDTKEPNQTNRRAVIVFAR